MATKSLTCSTCRYYKAAKCVVNPPVNNTYPATSQFNTACGKYKAKDIHESKMLFS